MRPLLLLLLLTGCVDLGPSWVAIGQGEAEHVELSEGDAVPIVQGPQGGYMVALSLRAGGLLAGDPADPTDPDNPRVTFQAFAEGVEDPLGSITVVRGLAEVDDELELTGTWLVFDAALDTSVYFDQPVELAVRVVDPQGNEAEDAATVEALWTDESTGDGREVGR